MKNITKLFSFLVLFICMIQNANAIVYTGLFDEPNSITYYSSDVFLITQTGATDNIKKFYPTGAGSTSTLVSNITSPVESSCLAADGELFFVCRNGEVYRKYNSMCLCDFTSQFDGNFQQIGDMDTLNMDRDIVVDSDKNVYSISGDDVIIFSYPSYSSSVYCSLPDVWVATDNVASLAVHPDGLIIGGRTSRPTGGALPITVSLFLYNSTGRYTIWSQTHTETVPILYEIENIYCTQAGDVYIAYLKTNTLFRLNYSDNFAESTISALANDPSGICINNDGIIFITSQTSDEVITYSAVEAQGGYSFTDYAGATGDTQLDYDVSALNSMYESYHNNSDICLSYQIEIDISASGIVMEFETIDEDYYFIVDLISPDGAMEKQSFITDMTEEGWLYVTSTANAHGTLTYTANVWQNGSWNAHLYEYNTKTGLRALLDSCEFEITNTVSTTDIIETTPGIDPTLDPISRIDALLESNAFIGLLIMIACIGAFGKVGGVAGIVLGTVVGVSLSVLLGYLPAWMLFLMVLALCVVFVTKLISGFGGNN